MLPGIHRAGMQLVIVIGLVVSLKRNGAFITLYVNFTIHGQFCLQYLYCIYKYYEQIELAGFCSIMLIRFLHKLESHFNQGRFSLISRLNSKGSRNRLFFSKESCLVQL